jgi:PAS domain-containing protein
MELSPHLLFHVDDRGLVLQEQRPERDLDGKILLWNEGARRMYGYEAEEVVGQTKLRGSRGSDLTRWLHETLEPRVLFGLWFNTFNLCSALGDK